MHRFKYRFWVFYGRKCFSTMLFIEFMIFKNGFLPFLVRSVKGIWTGLKRIKTVFDTLHFHESLLRWWFASFLLPYRWFHYCWFSSNLVILISCHSHVSIWMDSIRLAVFSCISVISFDKWSVASLYCSFIVIFIFVNFSSSSVNRVLLFLFASDSFWMAWSIVTCSDILRSLYRNLYSRTLRFNYPGSPCDNKCVSLFNSLYFHQSSSFYLSILPSREEGRERTQISIIARYTNSNLTTIDDNKHWCTFLLWAFRKNHQFCGSIPLRHLFSWNTLIKTISWKVSLLCSTILAEPKNQK